jgi:hypothetical protein
MKTRDLIALLAAADPSGEQDVVVNNCDILSVYAEEGYWDGCYQRLRRELEKAPYYNVTGADYVGSGIKISIRTYSISDMLLDHPDHPVGYIGVSSGSRKHYQQGVAETRMDMRMIHQSSEWDRFVAYMKQRLKPDWNEDFSEEEIEEAAREFAEKHLDPDDPMPKDIGALWEPKDGKPGLSWDARRRMQYDREIRLDFQDGRLIITREQSSAYDVSETDVITRVIDNADARTD